MIYNWPMSELFARGGRTIVGMIHLGLLPGQPGFTELAPVLLCYWEE